MVWHPHNAGYGANQKTCYLEALQRNADVVVMLHPDGQYEPELIGSMVDPILRGEADLVLGSRLAVPGMALANGMPRWKYMANRALTTVENRIMGTNLTEAHTGYRAYSRRMLLTVPFLRNAADFSFDSEMLMQASHFGMRIREVPANGRYFEEASSVGPEALHHLRHQDSVGRRPPAPAPLAHPPLEQVQVPGRQGRCELSPAYTGERVVTSEGGFNPTWQRHVAAYSLCERYLGQGRIADIGCGIGHSYRLLEPRETVGVDLDRAALEQQDRQTVVADMRSSRLRMPSSTA